jgi:membrane-associated phospholipid phosphatase
MRERILCAIRWGVVVTAWFAAVFFGAEWVTSLHGWRVAIDFEWERGIPFWPWMAVVYLSIFPLMWCAPLLIEAPRNIRSMALSLCAVIGAAGIGFLICPATLNYGPTGAMVAPWESLYQLSDWMNLDHNLVPSLHVALAVCCVAVYTQSHRIDALTRGILWVWAMLIALSTLLTHQHHVVDVAMGWVLGMVGGRLNRGINQSQV